MVALAHRWCNLSVIAELGSLRFGEAAAKDTAHNQKCCGKKQGKGLTDVAEKWTILSQSRLTHNPAFVKHQLWRSMPFSGVYCALFAPCGREMLETEYYIRDG
jgi:hypothetical protein